MCWFKKKKKIKPISKVDLGVQVFMYDDWPQQLVKAKELPINRIRTCITNRNYNQHKISLFLNRCKSLGIGVLATVYDEDDRFNTPAIAEKVARNHCKQNDLYMIEICNEVNAEISPGNKIRIDDYYEIYKDCFSAIREFRQDTHIYPAGLIASRKADIPGDKYLKKLIKLGIVNYIEDPIRQSAWNLHYYYEQWNEAEATVRLIRGSSAAEIYCTESGCAVSRSVSEQQAWYARAKRECYRLGISQLMIYGLLHAGNPMNPADDFALLNEDMSERGMFKYIQEVGL